MKRKDDRTVEQITTHPNIVGGRDTFMSGWGEARGGVSYAGWACRDEDVEKVYRWVKSRDEMRAVGVRRVWYPKSRNARVHIYVVTPGHPALA
jgi:hypothetical protein